MRELAGAGSHISFEGDKGELGALGLDAIPGADANPTDALQPAALDPRDIDFLVLPLPRDQADLLHRLVSPALSGPVWHVQIAVSGELVFGAYDNFDPNSVLVRDSVPEAFLEGLVGAGVLGGFEKIEPSR